MKNLNITLYFNARHIIDNNTWELYRNDPDPLQEFLYYEVGDYFVEVYNFERAIMDKYWIYV
jgi:hypothetical protein